MKKPLAKPDLKSIFGDDADKKPVRAPLFGEGDKPAAPKIFSDDDRPAVPKVFSEDEKGSAPKVFNESEKGRFYRYCKHYVVNPFVQRCALRGTEVQAADVCSRFEVSEKPAE